MVVFFLIPVVLAGFALLLLAGAAPIWLAAKVGLLRKTWQFITLYPVLVVSWPAYSYWRDWMAEAECVRLNGPDELSCGGELGGVFILIFKLGLIVASLIVGPFMGKRLAISLLKSGKQT